MRQFYFSFQLLFTFGVLYSQDVLWQKDYKSSTQSFINQVITTIDNQYLVVGSSIVNNSKTNTLQNAGYDFHLLKLNQQGGKVWEKSFSGQNHDFLISAVNTHSGGFLLLGTSFSDIGMDKKGYGLGGADIWLIYLDELGNELWQNTLGTTTNDEAVAVVQSLDMNFFIVGNTEHAENGFGSKDIILYKLDSRGNVVFEKIIGGKGLDRVEKMVATKDGGVLLGGYSRSAISGVKFSENYGEGDFWLVKISESGIVEWERTFGGSEDDHLKVLQITADGYVIGGESKSGRSGNKLVSNKGGTDLWIVYLSENGEEIWQNTYHFSNRDVLKGMHVIHTADDSSVKGVLLGGYVQLEEVDNQSNERFWVSYIDSKGSEQWKKYIAGKYETHFERLSDLKMNRDGSIILAGTSAEKLGNENWKIVKLSDKKIDQLIEKQDVKLYPNPVKDYCYVEIGLDFEEATLQIYDMGGRLLQQNKTKSKITKINTQQWIQGVYLLQVKTENKNIGIKIIKK